MKSARWAHGMLSAYMWVVLWLPVEDWNVQSGGPWLFILTHGSLLTTADLALLALVTLPTLLCLMAWRMGSARVLTAALLVDVVWMAIEAQARWIPYARGTAGFKGRLSRMAEGPTTTWLPSSGTHAAPDAMHTVLAVLLLVSFWLGVVALRRWWSPEEEAARFHRSIRRG